MARWPARLLTLDRLAVPAGEETDLVGRSPAVSATTSSPPTARRRTATAVGSNANPAPPLTTRSYNADSGTAPSN